MGMETRLHTIRNPLSGIRERFTRYLVICACTGILSFLVALILLHLNVLPLASLVISAAVSGLINYGAMEMWAFPGRAGRLSWKRLVRSSAVGAIGFLGRYGVLVLGLEYLRPLAPFDNVVALACAYLTSFLIGYLFRSRVIFRHPASVRLNACDAGAEPNAGE